MCPLRLASATFSSRIVGLIKIIVHRAAMVDLLTTVTTTAFTVLVTAQNGTYSPALNGIEQCVATNFGSARQLMYNFVNRTAYIPMTVARDNWGTAATAVPERVVAFWVAKDDKFRLLGMGYAVTGGILTVRHLAFGRNSIQTAIARDEKVYVSRAHLRVKNLNDMQPIWRGGKKRVVVGPTVRTESDEVTRDFKSAQGPGHPWIARNQNQSPAVSDNCGARVLITPLQV